MDFLFRNIIKNLKVGDKIDKERYEFLKNYDLNDNSIFDKEDLDKLKTDLKKFNHTDGNRKFFTDEDALSFYNNAMKDIPPTSTMCVDCYNSDSTNKISEWFQEVQNSNILEQLHVRDKYNNMTEYKKACVDSLVRHSDFILTDCSMDEVLDSILDFVENIENENKSQEIMNRAKEIFLKEDCFHDIDFILTLCKLPTEIYDKVFKSDICKNYESYDIIMLFDSIDFDKIPQAIDIMTQYKYDVETVYEMLNLTPETQEKAVELIAKYGNQDKMNIITLAPVVQYLPEDFFEKMQDYEVVTTAGGQRGYTVKSKSDGTLTILYDPQKGLYEIQEFDEKNNTKINRNFQTNTEELIQFTDNINEQRTIKKYIKTKYDSLEYNVDSNTYKYGNEVSTETITPSNVTNMYNITTIDTNGNQISPCQYYLSSTEGEYIVSKTFVSPSGVKTSYYYEETGDNTQILDYIITSETGDILLEKRQTMQRIDDNRIITSINDNVYEAVFNDDSLVITDKSTGEIKNIKLDFIKEGKDVVIGILKNIPANILMTLEVIPLEEISYDTDRNNGELKNNCMYFSEDHAIRFGYWDDFKGNRNQAKVLSNFFSNIFIHEFGHYIDTDNDTEQLGYLSLTDELQPILNKEFNAFIQNATAQEQEFLTHMIDNGDQDANSMELFAESFMALYYNPVNSEITSTKKANTYIRTASVMENFPEFIAAVYKVTKARIAATN